VWCRGSVYNVAKVLLESVLPVFNALVYSVLAYFTLTTRPAFGTLLLLTIVQANVGSTVLQFCALVAPNQDGSPPWLLVGDPTYYNVCCARCTLRA
jgi:hypothetical protein